MTAAHTLSHARSFARSHHRVFAQSYFMQITVANQTHYQIANGRMSVRIALVLMQTAQCNTLRSRLAFSNLAKTILHFNRFPANGCSATGWHLSGILWLRTPRHFSAKSRRNLIYRCSFISSDTKTQKSFDMITALVSRGNSACKCVRYHLLAMVHDTLRWFAPLWNAFLTWASSSLSANCIHFGNKLFKHSRTKRFPTNCLLKNSSQPMLKHTPTKCSIAAQTERDKCLSPIVIPKPPCNFIQCSSTLNIYFQSVEDVSMSWFDLLATRCIDCSLFHCTSRGNGTNCPSTNC